MEMSEMNDLEEVGRRNPMSIEEIQTELVSEKLYAPNQVFFSDSHMMKDICQVEPCAPFVEGLHCMASNATREVTDVPVEELRPCYGYCCGFASLFCGCPSCFGCTCSGVCLICLGRCSCCKCLDCADEDSRCCAICEAQTFCVLPSRCCENQCQICCVDARNSFPCSIKVPCLVNFLGFTCCSDFKCTPKCCAKVGELIPRIAEAHGKSMGSAKEG